MTTASNPALQALQDLTLDADTPEASEDAMIEAYRDSFKVGDGATWCGWSDRTACTVIEVGPRSITLQEDTAVLLNGADSGAADALRFDLGGFAAHVSGVQRYSYTPNPEGRVWTATWRPTAGRYFIKGCSTKGARACGAVVAGRGKHHDYNF